MQRRGLLGVFAFILALVGGVLVFLYVQGADERALANQQPVGVLVVAKDVPAGTSAALLGSFVEIRALPQVAIVPGAVTNLQQLPPQNVASTSLKAGEQVLASRFVPPNSADVTAPVPIPEGLQLVSVQLDPERVAGSQLKAGDKVGVFVSLKAREDGKTDEIAMTDLIANDVLVARVQGAPAQSTSGTTSGSGQSERLPGSSAIVTLAVRAPLAERIVFAQEFGSLWLSLQPPATDPAGIEVVHAGNVLK